MCKYWTKYFLNIILLSLHKNQSYELAVIGYIVSSPQIHSQKS